MDQIFINQTWDDFDDFAASTIWDLEAKQIDQGRFRVEFLFFGDSDLQIAEVFYNRKLLQHGTVLNGYTFAVNHPHSNLIVWRYKEFPLNGIIVFPENNEHQGVSLPNHHPFILTISEHFLTIVAEDLGLPEINRIVRKGEVHICEPVMIGRVQTFLLSLCNAMKNTSGKYAENMDTNELKWKITRLLLFSLASSETYKSRKRQFHQRKRVVDRVLEYIESDLAIPRSVPELCRVAEVDERTLRNYFYEQFTLSPKILINRYKLNVVRSAFKRIDSPGIIISDIANEAGFWHMGQFAKDYKKLFGELPSETIRRRTAQKSSKS
jgi:AraC family ethanolamine operon transcriptional activator